MRMPAAVTAVAGGLSTFRSGFRGIARSPFSVWGKHADFQLDLLR
jgi:hypothetical protein